MKTPRMVLAESAVLRQLFAIQDQQKMQNKDLAYKSGLLGNIISDLRRARHRKTPIEYAEKIAAALGYEFVLRPKEKR